ncbi:helix-turn-helix domain-containing protein [Streptacidiphilus sp. EB129]|uniref:helix-turn-helix domain-containing protein n=1 Tax=Streptacidiphilus sp. EB129 TaxID=3156262 RepID=UPI0035142204
MVQAWSSSAAAETGRRIRRLRGERGLSLSELARRADIGKATLSGLESGTRNPTAETLYAIAGQLGVPLSMLLSTPLLSAPGIADGGGTETSPGDASAAGPVGKEGGAVPVVHGVAVSATLLEVFTDAGMSTELYRLRIRPGAVQISPAHAPRVMEYLTVFAGTAEVGPVGRTVVVPAGGHAGWVSDGPHSYAALGGTVVEASLLIRHPLPGIVPGGAG